MKIKTMSLMCAIMLGLALYSSQLVYAASTLSLLSLGNGSYVLQGVVMEDVAALDVTITYDTSTLSNPRVTQGGLITGALMGVNPNVPGNVRMGIVTTSPIKTSGVIATLVFDLVGDSPGRILAIKANITNNKGTPLPVQAQIENFANEPASPSVIPPNAGTQSGATVAPAAPTPAQIVIGGANLPKDDSAATAKKEPEPTPEVMPEPAKEKAVVSQETVSSTTGTIVRSVQPAAPVKKIYSQKSVLDRFREYKGERSVKALTELFNQDPLIGFRQDPPIALADGKALVNISFIAAPVGKEKPDIRVAGAAMVSLKKDPDYTNTWIAELRPGKKSVLATLIVDQEKVHMVFPIVVAPEVDIDLDKSGAVTEADFRMFLLDRGSAHKPQFDLNNDGKRDYVDDYIFTANYIVKKTTETKPQTNKQN